MHLEQVKRFFMNFGLQVGLESESVSIETYEKIQKAAVKWHGVDFGRYVADCFIAVSEPRPSKGSAPPIYKLSHYDFDLFHAV